MKTKFKDRNNKEFKIGNICKYRKTIGGDFIFVVIKRKGKLGLHRQGFYNQMCAGCWDYTNLEEESFDYVSKAWDTNGKNYPEDYKDKKDYLDRYCIEIVGNLKEDKDKFDLDPEYYKH